MVANNLDAVTTGTRWIVVCVNDSQCLTDFTTQLRCQIIVQNPRQCQHPTGNTNLLIPPVVIAVALLKPMMQAFLNIFQ